MKSPAKFVREVKSEGSKVTWPKKREVWVACLMVVIVTAIMSVFFFATDWVVSSGVGALLKR
jgi:preprotein translocase subunit SecE